MKTSRCPTPVTAELREDASIARRDVPQRVWLAMERLERMVYEAVAKERARCAGIARAIDSGRGNEKEIAKAIERGAGKGIP